MAFKDMLKKEKEINERLTPKSCADWCPLDYNLVETKFCGNQKNCTKEMMEACWKRLIVARSVQ